MKISTKGRYALRMLLDLAQNQEAGAVALKDIADRQNISKKYLEQIALVLGQHGILRGSKLYVALFPCNECAKAIIQSGVREVLYLSDKYADSMATLASKRMMDAAGVKYTRLVPRVKEITLDLVPEEWK